MDIKSVYKIELNKLLHRKDVWALLTMVFIPMLYSVAIFMNSSVITFNSTEKEYAIKFCYNMYSFVYMVFIFIFIVAIVSTKTLSGEIQNRSILLYTQRINDRKKMYISKLLACISIFTIITLIFILICLIMYYAFAIHREDIISKIFIKNNELIGVLVNFSSIFLYYIFIIELSMMLGSYMKPNTTIIIVSIIIIVLMYVSNFPGVQHLSLNYYITQLENISMNDISRLVIVFMKNISIFLIYSVILNYLGMKKFERRDL